MSDQAGQWFCPWVGVNLNSTSSMARCPHCGGDSKTGHQMMRYPAPPPAAPGHTEEGANG